VIKRSAGGSRNTSKKTVFPVSLLLFLLVLHAQSSKTANAGRTWTVDDDGPADFHTVQEAVDAASNGDTIFVHNGTYLERVVVNKTISLLGENPFGAIIDAERSLSVISIEADLTYMESCLRFCVSQQLHEQCFSRY
jgi:nitrous oxidase accessory protein NosD